MKKQKGSKIKKDETMKKKTTDKVDDEKKDQVEIKTVDEELSFMPLNVSEDEEQQLEDAVLKNKSKRKRGGEVTTENEVSKKPNVIYLGRIPHGFYEDEMAGFFGQFGKITRLRLSRNKKTGKSKHFAFIEFESPEVAAVVADCMQNYLLFESLLQCQLVPEEKLHPRTWVGANKKFKVIPWKQIEKRRHNQDLTVEQYEKRTKRLLRRDTVRRKKLAEAGIEYEFDSFADLLPKSSKHTRYDEST